MNDHDDGLSRSERWARFRMEVIGRLLAAPPERGELAAELEALARRTWRHPNTGEPIRFGVSTLERWYYVAREADDPVRDLATKPRRDRGSLRAVVPTVRDVLVAQYHRHPSWSCQLHHDNLVAAIAKLPGAGPPPSYSSVRRFFAARGLVRQKRRGRIRPGEVAARETFESRERRSWEVGRSGELWHLDFHEGSRAILTTRGRWVRPNLLAIMDDHSRLVCHAQWFLDPDARSLIHGFVQAIQKRGLPRQLLTDNGSAMIADETTTGLADLGIEHFTTLPYTPEQNGKQEVFWSQVEGRLLAMLEGHHELSLELLNTMTIAWVEADYNRKHHSEIDQTPLERFLAADDVLRTSPETDRLRLAFTRRLTRKQRRSDGTVTVDGVRFEVPARFRNLARLRLRSARWDLSLVHLVDPDTGREIDRLRPVDKLANSDRRRRRVASGSAPDAPAPNEPTIAEPIAPLLAQLLAEAAATGLPPAFIPFDSDKEDPV